MQEKSFTSFSGAATYAKKLAQETGATVKVEKVNDNWKVTSSSTGALDKEKQSDVEEKRARLIYLEERELYYRELSLDTLEALWKNREKNSLEPDEVGRLRNVVRAAKGIESSYGTAVRACGQCGMVGENCTCGRTWF